MSYARFVAAALIALTAAPAAAQETGPSRPLTVSGSVGLASDYRFRGVSQTDRKPAIQGGLTASHKSGFYIGTWASNLAGWGTFGGSNTELDVIGGYKREVAEGVALDAGLTWYMYPGGASRTDFAEPYVKLSGAIGRATVLVGVAYAPPQEALGNWSFTGANAQAVLAGAPYDNAGDEEDNLYLWVDAASAVPDTPLTVKGHLGFSDGNPGLGPNGTSVAPTGSYADWMLGADLAIPGTPVTLGVAYVDTDIGRTESRYLLPNFSSTGDGGTIAGSQVVFSVSAAF